MHLLIPDSADRIYRIVATAAMIKVDDCVKPTTLDDEQYLGWLAETPRRALNISGPSREDRRKVLFGIDD